MMVAEIEAIPVGALGQMEPLEPAPRRRGRPPKLNADGTRANPPKAAQRGARGRTRDAGAPRARSATARGPKSLYPELIGFLTMLNLGIGLSPLGSKSEPTGNVVQMEIAPGLTIPVPETRLVKLGDELDEMEMSHLARAVDAQCQRSPRVKRYVSGFLGITSGAGLAGVVAMIVARRASRHGLIDPTFDGKLGAMLNGDLSALMSFVPPQAPEPPDTGETVPNRDLPNAIENPFDFAGIQ